MRGDQWSVARTNADNIRVVITPSVYNGPTDPTPARCILQVPAAVNLEDVYAKLNEELTEFTVVETNPWCTVVSINYRHRQTPDIVDAVVALFPSDITFDDPRYYFNIGGSNEQPDLYVIDVKRGHKRLQFWQHRPDMSTQYMPKDYTESQWRRFAIWLDATSDDCSTANWIPAAPSHANHVTAFVSDDTPTGAFVETLLGFIRMFPEL